MVTISFKQAAAPENVSTLSNVSLIGGQNTNTGTHSTDIGNALTGLGSAAFVQVTFQDPNNTANSLLQVVATSEIRAVL